MKYRDLTRVELEVQVLTETRHAWLVSDTGERKRTVWVPKSQAKLSAGVLNLPAWLAKEKELI